MKDLKLYKYSLLQHDLPLIAENCIIRNISSYLPWTSMMKDPIVVNITDVRFYIKSLFGDKDEMPHHSVLKEIREHQLLAHEQYKTQVGRLLMLISPKNIKSMLFGFVSQMKIKIERINIVIAIGDYHLGILIKEIEITDPVQKIDKTTRLVKLNGISAYLDKNEELINTTENAIFIQQMNNIYNENHNFIIKDFSTEAIATIDSQLELSINIDEINCEILPWQIEFLIHTASNIPRFMPYITTRNMTSDDNLDEKGLWKFIHKAATNISSPKTFIDKFKEMKEYLQNYKDSKNRNENIQKLDHSLDYNTIVLYRMLAEAKKGDRKLTKDQLEKVFLLVDTDAQIYLPNLLFTSPVHAEIGQVNLKVADFLCILNNLSFSMENKSNVQVIEGGFNSIQLKRKVGKIYTPFFESIENGRKDFNFNLALFCQNCLQKNKNEIALSCSASNYVINLRHLSELVIDASFIDSIVSFVTEVSKLRFEIPNLSVYLSPFEMVIHNGTNVHLTFECEGGITSTYKSDILLMELKSGRVKFGDEKDILLAENVFLDLMLKDKNLSINLQPPVIYIELADIAKLLEIVPEMPKIRGVGKCKFIDLLNVIPEFSFSLHVPDFFAVVGFPLTTEKIKVNIKSLDFDGNFNELKSAAFLKLKMDFKGISFAGEIFDKH
ncbi:hypothetical protein TVAG_440620 [Trichomonas vaginalis G3]|uniref:Uncharacterized protein n=1 Tax=Trichomonas vaginalis (strain ATCC PRA-98 / G3) TaxID=412133 RepID=A2G1W2_TRIV3|nr:regulation of parkin-mediated stimulation of mitophagy in response to mitochondrial depolarization [Trichomonas vaginalis G3]EAX88858.1 hypothetical protein TVAG_440620 [Trichomonas vaginalis G3]KAI5491795.1 regulation of parkin-mediated stimulation of mitophagy in response to mitochondrial depolarization [Trichomonas vaginalis G3]|eukprot:XP_001301788.1 hypothetical protein [Trichomonas vaginalis G3]